MYNNLIEEDVMILDNEFFKLNSMFESIDKYYSIKQRELEYNYLYIENVDSNFVYLYTETENDKNEKKCNILSRMIDRIIEFMKNIKRKIYEIIGMDDKIKEIDAKILKNKKISNTKIEINTYEKEMKILEDEEKVIDDTLKKVNNGTINHDDVKKIERTRNISKKKIAAIVTTTVSITIASVLGIKKVLNNKKSDMDNREKLHKKVNKSINSDNNLTNEQINNIKKIIQLDKEHTHQYMDIISNLVKNIHIPSIFKNIKNKFKKDEPKVKFTEKDRDMMLLINELAEIYRNVDNYLIST